MCALSIKVPIRKKSGNLYNDPHIKLSIQDFPQNLESLGKCILERYF